MRITTPLAITALLASTVSMPALAADANTMNDPNAEPPQVTAKTLPEGEFVSVTGQIGEIYDAGEFELIDENGDSMEIELVREDTNLIQGARVTVSGYAEQGTWFDEPELEDAMITSSSSSAYTRDGANPFQNRMNTVSGEADDEASQYESESDYSY